MKIKKHRRKVSLHSRLSLYHFVAAILPVILSIIITVFFAASLMYMIYADDYSTLGVPKNSRDTLTTYCCHFNIRSIEKRLRANSDDPQRSGLMRVYKRLESYGLVVCVESEDEVFYISQGLDEDYFYKDEFSKYRECFVYLNDETTAIRDVTSFKDGKTLAVTVMTPHREYIEKYNVTNESILTKFQFTTVRFTFFLLLVICLVALFDVFIVKSLSNNILGSINKLIRAAERIKSGNLEDPIEMDNSTIEFASLTQSFDKMRQNLKISHEIQKEEEKIRLDTYSGINHDSRTAITAIKGYTQGLIEGIANTEEKRERYLHAIYDSALTLEKLMESFSEVTNLENSEVKFKMIEKNMYDMIEKWYEESKDMFEEKKIILNFIYNCDKYIYCNIDTFQFERVVENLLSNSIKYKRPDSEFVKIQLIARLNDEKNMFELIYNDNGVGIRPEESERIFDRFYRSNEARSNVQHGSGVGLAIVKQIIMKHSGDITASGNLGQGLQLTVHLPITKTKEIE